MNKSIFAALSLAAALFPPSASAQVAKIGSTEYTTIEAAFTNAADGETITVTGDASITNAITVGKNITLDLQEFTISNGSTETDLIKVSSNATLTIKGNGLIVNSGTNACNIIKVLGTLNLESGTLRSCVSSYGVIQIYNGTFNMTGGCVENTCSGTSSKEYYEQKCTAIHTQYTKDNTNETILTGGKISSKKAAIYNASNSDKAKVDISDDVEISGLLYANKPQFYTTVPSYCQIYTTETTVGTLDNVIYNTTGNSTCTKLVLSDSHQFMSPKEFTATASSYTRDMTNAWGTLCVPFSIDIDGSNVEFYQITGVSDNELTLSQNTSDIEAGTPVVIKKKDTSSNQISIVGVANCTVCTEAADPTTSDANMYGTFTGTTIKNTDELSYYFIADNMFYQAGRDTTVPPFRSYFTLSNYNPNSNTWSPSPSFCINISGNEITGMQSATDTTGFLDGIVAVYNTCGIRQTGIQPGVNIVKYSNGATRKIIIK